MIEVIATVLSIIGAILVAVRQRVGFLLWIVANFLWIGFALRHGHFPMAILFAVYLVIAVIGWFYKKGV